VPKNVTIALPDELAAAMTKLPEVNWSAVARDSIENYVKLREKPDLAEVVQLLVKQRGSEYARGVQIAQNVARIKGNIWLDVIVREYNRMWWEEAEKTFKEDNEGNYDEISEVTFSDEYEGQLMLQAWRKHDNSATEQSDGFMEGFKKTVLDIHVMVRKGPK
jgi:hypothetical protein